MKRDLLVKLFDHMRCGDTVVKNFDFGSFYNNPTGCSTSGCMLGELPSLFPDSWEFPNLSCSHKVPRLKSCATGKSIEDLMIFFDLPQEAVKHLFFPESQRADLFGGAVNLTGSTALKDVLDNFEHFLGHAVEDINIHTQLPEWVHNA